MINQKENILKIKNYLIYHKKYKDSFYDIELNFKIKNIFL